MKQLMLLLFGAGVVTAGAQSPGGVKGTELWFQTLPVTADLSRRIPLDGSRRGFRKIAFS